MIDYALAKKDGPRVKAALTKAKKIVNVRERYVAVRKACTLAVKAWEKWGAWPDAWATWQSALGDAYWAYARSSESIVDLPEHAPRLEDL